MTQSRAFENFNFDILHKRKVDMGPYDVESYAWLGHTTSAIGQSLYQRSLQKTTMAVNTLLWGGGTFPL